MKKILKKEIVIVAIPILLFIFILGVIFYFANFSQKIREYKSTLCSLASGPYEVSAEYDGTTVRLCSDNQLRLLNFFSRSDYYSKKRTKPSGDVIHFYFKGETDWTVDIYEVNHDKILFDVQGEKNFRVTSDNNGTFNKYLKIGSPEGWEKMNIIIDNEN